MIILLFIGIVLLIAILWANGIDKEHSDYKGEDFLN